MASGAWLAPEPLLLASTSPTRRALLEAAGLPVDAHSPGVDERGLESTLGSAGPDRIAAELAGAKALAVSRLRPDRVVVGADQILVCEGRLMTKAATPLEAEQQLAYLAGRRHRLVCAAAVARAGSVERCVLDTASLAMRPLTREAIARYVALAGPAATRSVGAYEIEGLGLHLFERVDGAHATILGLPMLALLAEFRQMGLLAF